MPLLLFLYKVEKYSHSCLSATETESPSCKEANFVVRFRSVPEWNLFWCDCGGASVSSTREVRPGEYHLEISELGELFATAFQSAAEGLRLFVDYSMCSNISSLSEAFPARFTGIRSLTRVPTLMSLSNIDHRVLTSVLWLHTLRFPS